MTREEAVAVLKAFMKNPLFSDVHKAAFNIAIHDIKQRHDWDINNLILINKENYEPQTFKWCTDCKEYDQEKHCCHRWSKVIRDTVEEMKQEQEPKSEWEHDHEILKAYADGANEVLDKIRAEIETKYGQCDICEYFEDYDYEENDISEYRPIGDIADILQILDKYKAESEE